ncbi:uncharacterized protein CPUR_01453 [Claviceps purpurea 20.1]|uniref:TM7S3/TM198-like domain-containing protein n=1 Tax=Claviceps purpurea (strain 20.1) TaxID=1111077 RepID=M1WB06_CLAP2|nr:hypothetical protein E4U28_001269 [Claviceps purpurea]CCE27979.1 uncharacterized protein CPUR_01453 [Claviceps purpurea 20.1]
MAMIAGRMGALLLFLLFVQFAYSQSYALVKRDGGATQAASPTSAPAQSITTDSAGQDRDGQKLGGSTALPDRSDVSGFITIISPSTRTAASSVLPTATSSGIPDSSNFYNATIPSGQLPLPPHLTPGWGVAGVVMLVTGVVYTLVGIKNRWIHTFFSTAYMTALGVTVLIVYVINVPSTNALQGGYVVAVILSGCAVGSAAMFFKELTEGFGCALGGFCLSMWLLCLVPGGLVHTVPSKAAFIAIFTLAGFALYFSRRTRDYALIVLIAFGGSTVTVLGIDCFSRAGLKEFWAYVWAVNDNLFPLGADTYPVTKGIRVETAAIVFIFLVGIISQIKLWKIVREKNAKRAADRAQEKQSLEREEENVGRQIEELNARERQQWEVVYGNGTADSTTDSRATNDSENRSEKRLRPRYVVPNEKPTAKIIEMVAMSDSDQSTHGPDRGLIAAEDAEECKVTVRVAADDIPESATDVDGETLDEKANLKQEAKDFSDSNRNSRYTTWSRRVSQAQTMTEAPEVVPLPFTVPETSDVRSDEDRSSIATFAEDDEAAAFAVPRKHVSLSRRLSKGSVSLLRNLSQVSERTGGGACASDAGRSTEELVMGNFCQPEDDERSLAATVDEESVSGMDVLSLVEEAGQSNSTAETEFAQGNIEIHAQLGKNDDELHDHVGPQEGAAKSQPVSVIVSEPVSVVGQEQPPDLHKDSARVRESQRDKEQVAETCRDPTLNSDTTQPYENPKSVTSASSTLASLTRDRLPRPLSRVAMSYRTNEWAKHLSRADRPEPDELLLSLARATKTASEPKERPVSVNMEELQQTAEIGGPPPGMRRSASKVSEPESPNSVSRQPSKQQIQMPPVSSVVGPILHTGRDSPLERRLPRLPTAPPAPALKKTPSGLRHSSSTFMPIAEEPIDESAEDATASESLEIPQSLSRQSSVAAYDARSQASVSASVSAPSRSPIPGVVSYANPQTLIGQREMFLRRKSYGNLLSNTLEPPFVSQRPAGDAGSLHNYPLYAAAPILSDPDDVPLSQRKEMMRKSSMMSLSRSSVLPATAHAGSLTRQDSSNSLAHKSQTMRSSPLPSFAAREAQLANFRQSVQQDLRSGTPIMMSSGRETPFGSANVLVGGREAEIQRNIEMQRNVLMGQKEAEAHRREMQRREKEHVDRAFDERMRNGDMLEAHREAMRRMQRIAK